MLLALYIIILQHFGATLAQFQCVGTCYSGNINPRNEDTFHGKYINGYSYKNFTIDDGDPLYCYRSCIQDCRCRACQIKNHHCELLDVDHRFCGMKLSDDEEYVHYDLAQTQYTVKSHMAPNSCYNGCCKSNPCLNGGRCEDLCHNPKQKFFCHCPAPFTGRVCDKKVSSCLDFLRNSPENPPANREYTIYRSDNGSSLTVYCDFTTPNQAWTLIESFSLAMSKSFYGEKVFQDDYPRNANSPTSWHDFRMSLSNMKYIRTKSTLFRSTCQFQNRTGNNLGPDFLLGSLSEIDIINAEWKFEGCVNYTLIRIRKAEFPNQTAITYWKRDTWHIHIDDGKCGFKLDDKLEEEEFFGVYYPINPKFSCTATQQSTTQWWLGKEYNNKSFL